MLKRIEKDGILYSLVISSQYNPDKKYDFLTKDEDYLQIGINTYVGDELIPRHRHKELRREILRTEEVIFVRKGRLLACIYDDQSELLEECELAEGDVIYLMRGGHSFKTLEPTQILEVKQGPYYSKTLDKEEF